MRVLIASILSVAAFAAVCAAPAAALEPPDDALPLARQIDILAPLGARDELTARALRSYGFKAARIGDFDAVAAILKPLAEAGDKHALFALAEATDEARYAGHFFGGAVRQMLAPHIQAGDFEAVRLRAVLDFHEFANTEEKVQAIMARLDLGVEAGHAPSMRSLGEIHLVPNAFYFRSYATGRELLERAVALGDAEAAAALGDAYFGGRIGLSFFRHSNAAAMYEKAMALGGSERALVGMAMYTPLDRPYEKFAYARRLWEEYGSLRGSFRWEQAKETADRFLMMAYRGAWDGFETAAWFLSDHFGNIHAANWLDDDEDDARDIVRLCDFVRAAAWAKIAERGMSIDGEHPFVRPAESWRLVDRANRLYGFDEAEADAKSEEIVAWFEAGDPAAGTDALACAPVAPVPY